MRLLFDLGNTRLKWAWQDKDQWQTGAASLGEDFDGLMQIVGQQQSKPDLAAIASVVGDKTTEACEQAIVRQWHVPILRIEPATEQLGVINRYHDPQQLGSDRWAALVAARQETGKPVCVVSCGTAVTIDALNRNGEFIGGSILPGLELMRHSLTDKTAAIDVATGDDTSCQARATGDAVFAGTRYGLAGGVSRIVAEHSKIIGDDMEVLITGGCAESILPLLDFPAKLRPDLVLRGIAAIVEAAA
jgi:type III pantothenate kinase